MISQGLSKRVAGDYISRCKRVEAFLNLDLAKETKSAQRFRSLMLGIQEYSNRVFIDRSRAYSLCGDLRRAVRVFALFKWGSDLVSTYPSNHYLVQYRRQAKSLSA
jgi:hypothetical protein